MSVNVYKPHVLVVPEDRADREIATGFTLYAGIKLRNIQVLPSSGGWGKVLDSFINTHIKGLRDYPLRHLVLLIDFDNHFEERYAQFEEQFASDVRDRVFLLGTESEPERLKTASGMSYESIGMSLAAECFQDEANLWAHPLLAHNAVERERLNAKVKTILF